jgi:hypothetical protein
MRYVPSTFRGWVAVVFGAIGIGLLPWSIWLAESLKPHHESTRWDLAWSGFDTGLALLFMATAVAVLKRSPWVEALAAATGTVLVVDAWFDIILESHADELRNSIMLAVFAELPTAAFCFWIAVRSERFLQRAVEAALHLPAAGEGAAEGHLVRVLEVPPDREPTGEPGHADPAP